MLNKKKKDVNLLRPESPGERSRGRAKPRKPTFNTSQRNDVRYHVEDLLIMHCQSHHCSSMNGLFHFIQSLSFIYSA